MSARIDYWINDRSGDPLLVITGEVIAALTKVLSRLLREVCDLVGARSANARPAWTNGSMTPRTFITALRRGAGEVVFRSASPEASLDKHPAVSETKNRRKGSPCRYVRSGLKEPLPAAMLVDETTL